jgi:hypothetical protein
LTAGCLRERGWRGQGGGGHEGTAEGQGAEFVGHLKSPEIEPSTTRDNARPP